MKSISDYIVEKLNKSKIYKSKTLKDMYPDIYNGMSVVVDDTYELYDYLHNKDSIVAENIPADSHDDYNMFGGVSLFLLNNAGNERWTISTFMNPKSLPTFIFNYPIVCTDNRQNSRILDDTYVLEHNGDYFAVNIHKRHNSGKMLFRMAYPSNKHIVLT